MNPIASCIRDWIEVHTQLGFTANTATSSDKYMNIGGKKELEIILTYWNLVHVWVCEQIIT